MRDVFPENHSKKTIACVDLFCGAGGLTHGLVKEGIDVRAGVDVDSAARYPYESNNNSVFLERDVWDLDSEEIAPFFKKADYTMLAGCAPCQPFSTYSQGKRIADDRKWSLLERFGEIVLELSPDLVTMENVPQILGQNVFQKFIEMLKGYHIWYDIVDCLKLGIPQRRKRLVLLASKLGPIQLMSDTYAHKTVRDVISDLPPVLAGEVCQSDSLHIAPRLSELNLRRIRQSKPGGTWRDWDEDLVANCHKRNSGATYPAVYGRMVWDEPAPTVTTQCFGYGNGRFGHPEQDRAITLREAAIFQTFPESYKFVPHGDRPRFNVLGRLIGNAVPVRLGQVIGKSINQHMR